PIKAMKEFYRVLKPTGRLVFCELFFDPDYPFAETLLDQAAAAKFQKRRLTGNFLAYTLILDKNYIPPDTSAISDVVRSKEDARISYNRMSKWYDQVAGSSERKFVEMGLHELGAQEGEKVLEIGFGTGNGILSLAGSVGATGKVCGIDISENMLSITQERVQKAGYEQNVTLKCGDAVHLPFQSGFFDAVFMSFALELFDTSEIPIVLKECRRVLKKDGRIGIVAMAKKRRDNLPVRLYEWAHKKLPKLADCRPIYASRLLEESDFNINRSIEKSMWGLPVEIIVAEKPQK
ncbi:MAG: class I SAM-dependent methyltransferase, partial [Anaerolineaceae bacterium]|nr:class I SAM-dependent methyltransferase [Anaerolineaceae bacterium]